MTLTKKTVNASLWALVQNASRQIISTLVFLALVRFFLSKDEFGLVTLATLLILLLTVFVTQGLVTAIIQKPTIDKLHLDSAFWANVATSIVLMSLVILFADNIAVLMGDARIAPILQVLSIGLVLIAFSLTHEAIISRELRFKSLAIRTIVTSIASGVVGISVAMSGGGLWSLVAMQLTVQLSSLIVLWWSSNWQPRFRFSIKAYRELASTSIGSTGIALVSFINDFADQFIVGRFLGTSSLGVYFVAQKVVRLIFIIAFQSIINVVLPSFSQLKGDVTRARNAMLKAMAVTSVISFPVFLGLATTSDLIVPVIFGDNWSEAIPVMSVLSIWGVFASITYYFGPILQALGHTRDVLKNVLIGSIALIIFCLIGSNFGLIGFSISVLLTLVFTFPIWVTTLKKHIGVSFLMIFNACKRNLLASVLMILCIIIVRTNIHDLDLIYKLSISITTGFFSYLAFSYVFARENVHLLIALAYKGFGKK